MATSINAATARRIKIEYSGGNVTQEDLARKYGTSPSTISKIVSGEYQPHAAPVEPGSEPGSSIDMRTPSDPAAGDVPAPSLGPKTQLRPAAGPLSTSFAGTKDKGSNKGVDIEIGQDRDPEIPHVTKAKLKIRKTLEGNLLVMDHEDVDIVLSPGLSKIIIFPKDMMEEKTYEAQDRLFKFLTKKGVIQIESIRSGNVYGSMEALIPASEEVNSFDVALLMVSRWIEDEKPYFMYRVADEKERTRDMTDPDAEESTELGKIPHRSKYTKKGALVSPDVSNPQKPHYMGS